MQQTSFLQSTMVIIYPEKFVKAAKQQVLYQNCFALNDVWVVYIRVPETLQTPMEKKNIFLRSRKIALYIKLHPRYKLPDLCSNFSFLHDHYSERRYGNICLNMFICVCVFFLTSRYE
jgi:hypothetical protein